MQGNESTAVKNRVYFGMGVALVFIAFSAIAAIRGHDYFWLVPAIYGLFVLNEYYMFVWKHVQTLVNSAAPAEAQKTGAA